MDETRRKRNYFNELPSRMRKVAHGNAYWDDLLGTNANPAAVDRLAEEIRKEQPAASFTAELANKNIRDWA